MKAGVPQEKTAWGLNQLCGSGLRAVALGMQQIANGDAKVIVAGGMESMSMSPHVAHMRNGTKMGDVKFLDSLLRDGLLDAFHGYHMGQTAENVATKWQISRDEQDEFALASQNKAEAAQKAGKFKDEIAPVTISTRKGDMVVDQDEYIKSWHDAGLADQAAPAFNKEGTVTAGNASGINDGAAAVVLMSADEAKKRGLTPLAKVASGRRPASIRRSWAQARSRPARKALEKAGWKVKRSRSRRGQRGLRRAGHRRQQGSRLGYVEGQRQRRRHRHRSPDRRVGRPRSRDAAA
jgi:acetyl-CoA C-acetyltransferase